MSSGKPVQIIEINLISAQDLKSMSKPSPSPTNMQTCVVAYINPKEKTVSRIDRTGNANPTWNDKFVFAVDEEFRRTRPNACLVMEICRVRRFRKDKKIGVVHVLLEDLLKIKEMGGEAKLGKNCMPFLVKNPSGEPHGIINIGAATLNGMFHEELPKFFSSKVAVDHRKLMGSGYKSFSTLQAFRNRPLTVESR